MSDKARRTRRAIGLTFLATAVLLLFAGQTVLHRHLQGTRFALYWLLCLLLVTLALAIALLDLLAIRHQARRQQLDLLHHALDPRAPAAPPPRNWTAPGPPHPQPERDASG
ncbi:MAG: hypothetical protein KJ072_01810 [Verrucomicrobia bacterium]|nr:hypothetical protein [Verrucomicrobiota bacterium]